MIGCISLYAVISFIEAIIKHGLKIGDDSIVGANSYLNKVLKNNQIAYGTPAKLVRARNIFDRYMDL
jgi:acetyltransferase-like isoleucine patch superfamily enzyme